MIDSRSMNHAEKCGFDPSHDSAVRPGGTVHVDAHARDQASSSRCSSWFDEQVEERFETVEVDPDDIDVRNTGRWVGYGLR